MRPREAQAHHRHRFHLPFGCRRRPLRTPAIPFSRPVTSNAILLPILGQQLVATIKQTIEIEDLLRLLTADMKSRKTAMELSILY